MKLFIIFALFFSTQVSAGINVSMYNQRICTSDKRVGEFHLEAPILVRPEWGKVINENLSIFNPDYVNRLRNESGLRRDDVSSAHIVNILAKTFKRLELEKLKRLQKQLKMRLLDLKSR